MNISIYDIIYRIKATKLTRNVLIIFITRNLFLVAFIIPFNTHLYHAISQPFGHFPTTGHQVACTHFTLQPKLAVPIENW